MGTRSCGPEHGTAQAMGRCALALLVVLALGAPGSATGDVRIHARVSGVPALEPGTRFDLHLVRENLGVAYADDAGGGDLRLRRIGIAFHEPIAEHVRLGVRLGGAGYTQSGRSVSAGIDPAGYYGALELVAAWPRDTRLGLDLGVSWRYTSVDETDTDGDRLAADWQTLELRPALRVGLSRRVSLRAGPTFVAVDGDERLRNGTARTTGFEADGSAGGLVALDFALGRGDAITLRARGGNPEGLFVSFEQQY